MMQRDVRVASVQTREKWNHQARECIEWIASERAEQQVEPNYIGLQSADFAQHAHDASWAIWRPTAHHFVTREFTLGGGKLIGKNCQVDKRIALQLLRNMEAVFAQSTVAGGEGCD